MHTETDYSDQQKKQKVITELEDIVMTDDNSIDQRYLSPVHCLTPYRGIHDARLNNGRNHSYMHAPFEFNRTIRPWER